MFSVFVVKIWVFPGCTGKWVIIHVNKLGRSQYYGWYFAAGITETNFAQATLKLDWLLPVQFDFIFSCRLYFPDAYQTQQWSRFRRFVCQVWITSDEKRTFVLHDRNSTLQFGINRTALRKPIGCLYQWALVHAACSNLLREQWIIKELGWNQANPRPDENYRPWLLSHWGIDNFDGFLSPDEFSVNQRMFICLLLQNENF